MKTFKKIFIAAVFLIIFIASTPLRKINAAETFEEYLDFSQNPSLESLNKENISNTIFQGLRSLAGNPNNPQETGALQYATQAIAAVFANPPASGVYYAYDVLHHLGATPAYAQGVGFTGLRPILPIWKAIRNATYVLFTIILITMGVLIMFRIKISPQAVITIENAIPKIVGGLILVTFSYAIAGFLIDIMYVVMALGIIILNRATNASLFSFLQNVVLGGFQAVSPSLKGVIDSGFFALIPIFFSNTSILLVGALIGTMINTLLSLPMMAAVPTATPIIVAADAFGGITVGSALVMLIWTIIALFCLIKLFFGLIKAYIRIILSIILGPLQIMAGAIPGFQSKGFGGWIMGLIAELAIFPAVVIVALIGACLINDNVVNLNPMWIPPLIGPPLASSGLLNYLGVGQITGIFVKTIIGIGFILILSNLPDMVRAALGIKGSPWESAIGQAIAPGVGVMAWPFKETFANYNAARAKATQERIYEKLKAEQTPAVSARPPQIVQDIINNVEAIGESMPLIGRIISRRRERN